MNANRSEVKILSRPSKGFPLKPTLFKIWAKFNNYNFILFKQSSPTSERAFI